MSEYEIPFHVQEEIMKRLPVKSLIQFRSVSKAWKSLIDSPEFIAAHSLYHHMQQQHLLVSYDDSNGETHYASYIDDDTFPRHKSLPTLPLPLSTKQMKYPSIVGSSRGLLCVYDFEPGMALVWNPSIRKYIVVTVPNDPGSVAFGVCPVTCDTKIVAVTQSWDESNIETSYQCEVMVNTLSSGKWRSLSGNLPTERIQTSSSWSPVVTDGFIYWHAESHTHDMILSFDVTNENFEAISLPNSNASNPPLRLSIYKIRESLALVEYTESFCSDCNVWMMEDGVGRSFTKLFTIERVHDIMKGFRRNGAPIMVVTDLDVDHDDDDDDDDDESSAYVLYDYDSDKDYFLEMCTSFDFFNVNSYMETLLLLGRPECSSY